MPHFLGKNFLCQSQLLFFYCKTEAVNTVFLQTNDYLRYEVGAHFYHPNLDFLQPSDLRRIGN